MPTLVSLLLKFGVAFVHASACVVIFLKSQSLSGLPRWGHKKHNVINVLYLSQQVLFKCPHVHGLSQCFDSVKNTCARFAVQRIVFLILDGCAEFNAMI